MKQRVLLHLGVGLSLAATATSGSDPARDMINRWTALFDAIHNGQIDAVCRLLEGVVDPLGGAALDPTREGTESP